MEGFKTDGCPFAHFDEKEFSLTQLLIDLGMVEVTDEAPYSTEQKAPTTTL